MHSRPVRLGLPAMAPPGAGTRTGAGEQPGLQLRIGDVVRQRPAQPRRNRRIVNRTVDGAVPIRRAISRVGIPADFNLITSRTWRIASLSVGIQVPLRKAERRDRIGARRGLITPGDIIPEWRATSNRNGGRDHSGMVGDIERNQHTGSPLAGPRNCTAQIVASSVSRTSPRASTPASKWCAFLSVAARGRHDGRHMRRLRPSRMVSAFAPASRGASRCCSEAAA